jgi:gamma-glutamyltranspeptidase/glutathione hydrolase
MLELSAAGMFGLSIGAASGQDAQPASSDNGQTGDVAAGSRWAVATVSRHATEAAMHVLRQGGNAADAAVAAGLMLAVVDGYNSGLGGGCFIVARRPDGSVMAIDGRETAPALATRDMFIRNGIADPNLSQVGALASGVPGAVASYHRLATTMGTGRWKQAVNIAAEKAEEGFIVDDAYAARVAGEADNLAKFEGSRAIFFDKSGRPLAAGAKLVQLDLAKTLREIAVGGADAFYQGRVADLVQRWMIENGGLIRRDDLASYRPRDRHPVITSFRGNQIYGFPPPSSGGVHVAQILAFLDRFDLRQIFSDDPATYYHVLGEAMRLAFADRAQFLGDPSFAEVPEGLIDPDYLQKRSTQIDPSHRIPIVSAGAPPGIGRDLFGRQPRHTTHFSVADSEGNWVAITATVNTTFGSCVVIPGTGVVMNNQMDDFAIAPGTPNAFGLIGSEANAPAAGKRPLSSMSPTLVVRDGTPVISCGAAGGPKIISATAQILLNHLALGQSVEQAVASVRIHHQWSPDRLVVENSMAPEIVAALKKLGHTVVRTPALATAQAIGRDEKGTLTAVAEPRINGFAAAM